MGIRIDYLSPTLYVTDILIITLFFFWLKRYFSSLSSQFFAFRFSPFAFFAYLLLNALFSNTPLLGFYGFIKLLEYFFLGIYVAQNIKSKDFTRIALLFSITLIIESLLAIAQYINQGSLNGPLYFLGERKFTSETPGIANASVNGELILRPYGTFPHPNVLAGFLLCELLIVYAWIPNQKDIKRKLLKTTALLLGSLAIILTLSRIAILLWLLLIATASINWLIKQIKIYKKAPLFISARIFLIVSIIISIFFFTPVLSRFENTSLKEEAITQRAELFKSTLTLIQSRPIFGAGLYNFLPSLSHIQKPLSSTLYLQPVHNIFLLITAEVGIMGLSFFLLFLFKAFKHLITCHSNNSKVLLLILSVILTLGLFDHYWLTIQQAQLLFALILGLIWAL